MAKRKGVINHADIQRVAEIYDRVAALAEKQTATLKRDSGQSPQTGNESSDKSSQSAQKLTAR